MENKDLVIKIDDKITKYKVYKIVVKSGGGGAVSLPKDLIGRKVCIELLEDSK